MFFVVVHLPTLIVWQTCKKKLILNEETEGYALKIREIMKIQRKCIIFKRSEYFQRNFQAF